jgi:amino acid transporter
MLFAAALLFILMLIVVGAIVWQKQATGSREPKGGIAVTAALALVVAVGVMLSLWWRP